MGTVAQVARTCLVFVFLVLFALPGGILNRARGSGSNIFGVEMLDYWGSHIVNRGVMAAPTGALVGVLGGRPYLALAIIILFWTSELVGWGTYFGMAVDRAYTSRIGIYDWLFGREQPAWDYWHRWARVYAAMTLRGLVWTTPPGYLLYRKGYGWEFALVGALMSAVYCTGQNFRYKTHVPDGASEFAFAAGVPWCETIWGIVLWLTLLSMLLGRLPKVPYHSKVFEGFVAVFNLTSIVSTIYYATIKQCDKRNWDQTLVGMLVSAVVLAAVQAHYFWQRRRGISQSIDLSTPSKSINDYSGEAMASPDRTRFGFNQSVVSTDESRRRTRANDTEYGFGSLFSERDQSTTQYGFGSVLGESTPTNLSMVEEEDDVDVDLTTSPLLPVAGSFRPPSPAPWIVARGFSPFGEVYSAMGWLAVLNVVVGTIALLIAAFASFHAERTCTNVTLEYLDKVPWVACLSDHVLHSLGCSELAQGGCVTIPDSSLPAGCNLPF